MSAIEIHHLSFTYQDRRQAYQAVTDLSLTIGQGEFVCLIGHSGCGKSTLLNILAGLLQPGSGQIMLGKHPLTGPGTERAVVFQHYSLFPWMTARQNVVFGIRQAQHKLSKAEANIQADYSLQQVGMFDFRDHYPHQLSGGMQQRVAIARALAMDAEILLLDEPFGALDAQKRRELQQLLEQLWLASSRPTTVLLVTHDIEEAVLLGDRILFMRPGNIAADLPVPYARPREREQILNSASYLAFKQQLLELFYLDAEPHYHEAI